MLHTRLTELLECDHPVMLAGMGGVAYAELVAAVSEAGGFGTLGAARDCLETAISYTIDREQFDVAVARSFGNPAVTAECVAAFLRLDARLFVSEPKGSEDRWPAEGLAVLGLVPGRTHDFTTTTIRELCRCEVGLVDVPRPVGVPAKRPRF